MAEEVQPMTWYPIPKQNVIIVTIAARWIAGNVTERAVLRVPIVTEEVMQNVTSAMVQGKNDKKQ